MESDLTFLGDLTLVLVKVVCKLSASARNTSLLSRQETGSGSNVSLLKYAI